MASASMFQDEFSCSICLDLLKDPVTVPCGHSFCLNCITGCWDQEDQKGVYSCPQCRETFNVKPVLRRNTMMANVVEKLKKIDPQTDAKTPSCAGPGDVECDFCTGRKLKAIKSCLTCLVSYCEVHIQPHFDVPRFNKHKLVSASSQLQEKICSQHDRIIEVFCRNDQKLICMLCSLDDHDGHKTVSTIAEWTEKQNSLVQMKNDNQSQIQQMKNKVQEVKQTLEALQASTQKAVEETERIFSELISFLEQKRSEVTEKIRAVERAEESRAEALLEQLELEITTLKSIDAEMEKLTPIEDPIDFIQSYQALFSSAVPNSSDVTFAPQFSFSEMIKPELPSLKDKTKEFLMAILKVTGFMTGDTVKLKYPGTISKNAKVSVFCHYCQFYKGGNHSYNISINGVGKVTGLSRPNYITVNFPDWPDWSGNPSLLEPVFIIN